jgi:hypothetical protein
MRDRMEVDRGAVKRGYKGVTRTARFRKGIPGRMYYEMCFCEEHCFKGCDKCKVARVALNCTQKLITSVDREF